MSDQPNMLFLEKNIVQSHVPQDRSEIDLAVIRVPRRMVVGFGVLE